MATARRTGGSAVLLHDGRVLIAGGRTAGLGVTAAFQIWDPATETFGPEGSMNESRRSHRYTLLNDGSVLIAGGRDAAFNWLDSAELFDPTTEAFSYTAGTMQLQRGSHTQELLPSGEVLLAGGISDSTILLSFGEIYDPTTQTFRLTDVLTSHRSGTRPTRLADGRVLIVGGLSFFGPGGAVPTSTVEIFNPWPEGTGSKAVFMSQPMDLPVGQIVAPSIQVAAFDGDFEPIAYRPVTLEMENYFGGDPTIWVENTDANGIATFDSVWFDVVGPGRRVYAEVLTVDGPLETGLSSYFDVVPLVVTNTRDDGWGSLRRAIQNSERTSGFIPQTISFDIPGAGPHQIDLVSELPLIWNTVTIDGSTQPGYSDTPLIRIDASLLSGDGVGIPTRADEVELRALMITGAPGWGVRSTEASFVTIEDCFVGTDGSSPLGNRVGLEIRDGSGHLVTGNVVSGNVWDGIIIVDASNSTFSNNAIGTDPSGSLNLGNGKVDGGSGLVIANSHNNTISNNIISGSSYHGIDLKSGSTFNTIVGNTIGLNAAHDATIPNEQNGIHARWNVANNTIGGLADGDENVIGGNGLAGIRIEESTGPHTIQGNLIGTNTDNPLTDPGLGNGDRGIQLWDATDTVIGGADPAARNVVAWNFSGIGVADSTSTLIEGNVSSGSTVGSGIVIQSSDNTQVYSNLIGTNAAGDGPLGNHRGMIITLDNTNLVVGGPSLGNTISGNRADGIWIIAGDPPVPGESYLIENNNIGTDVTGSFAVPNSGLVGSMAAGIIAEGSDDIIRGNIISGNLSTNPGWTAQGVRIRGSGNLVEGNFIGTDAGGSGPIPNTGSGVLVESSGSNNQIVNNTISGNLERGVHILGGFSNTIESNRIGTSLSGLSPIGNELDGVLIDGSESNQILGNLISANLGNGIAFVGGATYNKVLGNYVGTDISGTIALGNTLNGVHLQDFGTDYNSIGGPDESDRNIISGNQHGITLYCSGNSVRGNYIGTDITGTAALSNSNGIRLSNAAQLNTVEGNLISGNQFAGVLFDATQDNNVVAGNFIGTDSTGTAPLGNTQGIVINGSFNNFFGSNLISGNSDQGIVVGSDVGDVSAGGNWIFDNSIHGNGGLGIDLASDGVTLNDPDDADNGPNSLMNFPTLISAQDIGGVTNVSGEIGGTAFNSQYDLQIFSNEVCDPSGYGEGETLVYEGTIDVPAGATVGWSVSIPLSLAGNQLTATMTLLSEQSTSEFSSCIAVGSP
jgi:titin